MLTLDSRDADPTPSRATQTQITHISSDLHCTAPWPRSETQEAQHHRGHAIGKHGMCSPLCSRAFAVPFTR
eukprot:10987545-Alexandrium_andersonii.AAC.1